MRAARIGLVVGVLVVIGAAYSMVHRSHTTPTCDGRQMSATDKCITHYADGHTVTQDYTQAKGHYGAGPAWIGVAGGVALSAVSLAGWQQRRRRGYRLGEA